MATKKLKIAPAPFLVPEGLYILPAAVILYQKSTRTLWANPVFEKEFGTVHSDRFAEQPSLALIRERPLSLQLFSMIGRHEGFAIDNRSGQKTPVELKVAQYGDASQETYLILVEDISGKAELENQLIQKHLELQSAFKEVKEAQNALIQSAKLASLGEMASGIAHELNQPLQAILGFSQELQHLEKMSDTGEEFLGDIVNGAKKMAEIIKSLRSFARQAGDDFTEMSVTTALEESRRLMHHSLLQNGVEFDFEVPESMPSIMGNEIQLEQVFINLFSNARDAIESAKVKRGMITVRASCVGEKGEEYVEVHVSDNGCGMSEDIQQKIFDPFFTTKEVGKGTGLGLSISYGILKKFGATTQVKSKLNQGTEFIIRFPIRKGTPS